MPTDPYALPCHPDRAISAQDRDWRSIGVKDDEGVTRKQTRCPECKTAYTAYQRAFGEAVTVEWLRHTPFRVSGVPVDGGPLWQDAETGEPTGWPPPEQPDPADLGPLWERSTQLCAVVAPLLAGGIVFAEPGDVLLERRERWNAQDRRLALLWSPRLGRPVVAWHGFARLLQAAQGDS